MNKDILNINNQDFINENLEADTTRLLLSKSTQDIKDLTALVNQIESKNKCRTKLPTWFSTPNIYYPEKINLEQTSSEITAKYKSKLFSGKVLLDLTTGFGVDTYYFSKRFDKVIGCEIDADLADIARHNMEVLNVQNVEIVNADGLTYLQNHPKNVDLIYLDPSRRNDVKGKVFRFEDSEPNVIENMDLLFRRTDVVLIKSSPLLDITSGVKGLKSVSEIHIVAMENEVKELLWILRKRPENRIHIITVNIRENTNQRFSFYLDSEETLEVTYSLPMKYLYEPNSAILKSGAFKSIANEYGLYKLHQNSHLYTSDELIEFPGRIFRVSNYFLYNKKQLKKILPGKANITVRNFPKSVSEIRKELKINDGGNIYLFFTTDKKDNKIVVVCEKIQNKESP